LNKIIKQFRSPSIGLTVVIIVSIVLIVILINPQAKQPNLGKAYIGGDVEYNINRALPRGCSVEFKGCSVGVAPGDDFSKCPEETDLWPSCSFGLEGRGCSCSLLTQSQRDALCNQQELVDEANDLAEKECAKICTGAGEDDAVTGPDGTISVPLWACKCEDGNNDGKCDLINKDPYNECFEKGAEDGTSDGKDYTTLVCWYPKTCPCDKIIEVYRIIWEPPH